MSTKKNTRSVIKLPMEQAAVTLFAMGITNYQQYTKLCADGERPDFLPSSLTTYYTNYPGWEAFHELGKNASNLYEPFFGISYADVKKVVHEYHICTKTYIKPFKLKSSYQWRNFCREGRNPGNIPVLPDRDYAEFTTWADFLGYEDKE